MQLLGALTIRGVTRPTTWEGTVEFRVMRVLSIEDHIHLEVDLALRPASWRRPLSTHDLPLGPGAGPIPCLK